jgi:hypothetical protein
MHPKSTPVLAGTATTRALLGGAVIAGPVFFALAIAQMLMRAGFDVERHPLSLLSLGQFGWIQATNFIATGLLVLAGGVGFRCVKTPGARATWGPLLIALFGAGTVVAGLFPPDAAFGFPSGAPGGMPARVSSHGMLHGIGFDIAFLSVIVAAFVFARRYRSRSERSWRAYSLATGCAIPVLIVAGMILGRFMGLAFFVTGLVAFSWLTAVASQQRTLTRENRFTKEGEIQCEQDSRIFSDGRKFAAAARG